MSKFYAVRQGRQPGIYTEWAEAKAQIHQYKEAIYKSFQTRAEAEAFMQQGGKEEIPEGLPIAFIDGSFSKSAGLYSYGGFIEAAGSYFILQGTGSNPEYMPDRNIAGELLGALNVSFQAQRMGLKEIVLYFDYAGIEQFAKGSWKAKTAIAKHYQQTADLMTEAVKVYYSKVKGHTEIAGNEIADYLAKEAAGAKLRKKDIKALAEFRADPAAYFLKADQGTGHSATGRHQEPH